MAFIICPNCGKENSEGSKFCVSCGKKLDAGSEVSAQGSQKESFDPVKSQSGSNSSKPGFFSRPIGKVTIFVIIAAAAVLVVVALMWQRSRQTSEPEAQEIEKEVSVLEEEDGSVQNEEDGNYLLTESDQRYYTESELSGLSEDQLRLARNEIYARHGRIFDSDDLREYFESQPWYQGTVRAEDFSDSVFNEYEKANIKLIQSLEDSTSTTSGTNPISDSDQICTFIPIDESCSYDLNGDGVAETISVSQENFNEIDGQHYTGDTRVRLTINGSVETIDYAGLIDSYYILNIDSSDDTLQIGIPYYWTDGGDGYTTAIFSFDNTGIHKLGSVLGTFSSGYDEPYPSISCPGDGTIESYKALSVFETWFASATWMLKDGELVELVPKVYEPLDIFDGRGIDLTVLQNIYVTVDDADYGERIILPAGTKVHMNGTNNLYWVSMTADGYEGNLYLQLDNKFWVFPAGSEEEVIVNSVFDNMTNWG